jgi:hypothetical protein
MPTRKPPRDEPKLESVHTHKADDDLPLVTVHIADGERPISPTNPAHAFGPFRTFEEAESFETNGHDWDDCHKVSMALVGGADGPYDWRITPIIMPNLFASLRIYMIRANHDIAQFDADRNGVCDHTGETPECEVIADGMLAAIGHQILLESAEHSVSGASSTSPPVAPGVVH